MSESPKKAVVYETETIQKCIGYVCTTCSRLHTTDVYLCQGEEAEAAALDTATRCCVKQPCACGAEAMSTFSSQCKACWRAEQDAKDRARFDAAPKQTLAEYLAEEPDGYVSDGYERFWSVSEYVTDEAYLRYPRVWFCEPLRGIKLDAGDIVESWADARHEGAVEDLDLGELQTLLDGWCAKQDTVSWFATDTALDPAEVERLCREAAERDNATEKEEQQEP